jgi:hypothetical protein
MARIEQSIEIKARPMEVFRFSHDLDRRPEWDERVVDAEMITPPPVRRGSVIRIDAGRGGQFHFTWDAEYTTYQIPSSSTLKVLDAAPSAPFRGGTETWRIDQTGEYRPRGIIARIMDVLGRRAATGRAIRHSLQNLKNMIEKG